MAGLDGIKRKIDPTALGYGPFDKNIYELSDAEKKEIRAYRVPWMKLWMHFKQTMNS